MPFNFAYSQLRALTIQSQLHKAGFNQHGKNLPIIYIPGIIGTKLYDRQTRRNIWGDPRPLLKPNPNDAPYALDDSALMAWTNRAQPRTEVARVIATEQLHSFAIIPNIAETLVTKELKDVLETALGYKENRDLFFLGHDWRQDYRLLSLQLDELMAHITQVFGHTKVIVIGQSVANLAIEFWLQNSSNETLNRIARWYAFGPTWQGTFHALSMLHQGYYPASQKFKGFTPQDVSTYPSCYQLLPYQLRVINHAGDVIKDFSLHDTACWQDYKLGPWHTKLKGTLTKNKLKHCLQLSSDFQNSVMAKPNERTQKVSQVWFLSDANQSVYAAVAKGQRLLLTAKEIQQEAPELAHKALSMGDDHLPLQDFIDRPNGPFVRHYDHIPYGENYMLIGQPKDHRALINYGKNLKALAFDIAVIRQAL